MSEAQEQGRIGDWNAEQFATLFETGSEGERIAALGMMQGNPRLVNVDAIVEGIAHSRSAFEQWQALFTAQKAWGSLPQAARDRITAATNRQMREDGYIQPGTDRHSIASRLLAAHEPTAD